MDSVVSTAPRVVSTTPRPTQTAPPSPTRIERRRERQARRGLAAPFLIGLATLVLRLATAANGPTDWDSAQYAAAVGHFDVTHGQPQPPGYWLYVMAGRFVHAVTGVGTIHSLVLVAALASAVAAGLTVVAGRDLGGSWVGLAAGLVVATCPFAWFSGSTVATYSFDMVACPLLIVLAWRARPGSWHGMAAAVALGLLAGFRQSIVESFAVLALIAVVASTRRWSQLAATVVAGAAAVAVWLVPLSLSQPGGFAAWVRATRTETNGAAQASSVFVHASAGALNFGTFAGYTVVCLAPLAVLTVLAGLALAARALLPTGEADRMWSAWSDGGDSRGVGLHRRPWYQLRSVILAAAIIPPVLLVTLLEFAKGGYLLAYLPAAVILLLLPLGSLNRTSAAGRRSSRAWLVVTSLGIVLVMATGTQRFLDGNGVLPQNLLASNGLWLVQARYQAPYADTRPAIRAADLTDTALVALGPTVGRNDVVVFDTIDEGANIYRNAGWSLPDDRIALIAPGQLLYNELHGALYYAHGAEVAVGPTGSVLLVASPSLPGLAALVARHQARPVDTPLPVGGYQVFKVRTGAVVLGVRVVARSGPRPLGSGI
jgi:hypothetical protein